MTLEELVQAAAGGDEEAFAELIRRHEKKVYNLALRICGNTEDACDAAQEAFLSAWKGLPNFRGEAGFSTWLYRLTSNASIDLLRRNKKQRGEISLDDAAAAIDPIAGEPSPQEQAEGVELREAVTAGLALLSEDHRQALVLREMRELSYGEIASELGVDLGTVKSRISRARSALRKILLSSGNLSGYLPSKPTDEAEKGGGGS